MSRDVGYERDYFNISPFIPTSQLSEEMAESSVLEDGEEHPSTSMLRSYLRIRCFAFNWGFQFQFQLTSLRTEQPNPNYVEAVQFLKRIGESMGLTTKVSFRTTLTLTWIVTTAVPHDGSPGKAHHDHPDDHHQVTECVPGKPALVVTWLGLKPDLPAIGLNSHMDVVSGSQGQSMT